MENLKSFPETFIFITVMTEETNKNKNPAAKWIKRFGVAGFLFFFIKGLIWLAIFVAAGYFGWDILD